MKRVNGALIVVLLLMLGCSRGKILQQEIAKKHPNWSPEVIKQIVKKDISLGMTQKQVLLSWGDPDSISTIEGLKGVYEQWIYGREYLYFRDGVLTQFKD